ncbi:hypothetical protein MNBD_GAMMA25-1536 [hydrothermal vent metagenome]|uniref:Uncharacterized protein n=1 Tax=hydrothermal vent metagenome TaxID=652676 RepID=A0A3B1B6C8_9ZZZZ
MITMKIKYHLMIAALLLGVSSAQAHDNKKQVEPIELLIDFKIEGHFTGFTPTGIPVYTIGGPG